MKKMLPSIFLPLLLLCGEKVHAQIINTIAGLYSTYWGDWAPATYCGMVNPWFVAVDKVGNVFIADITTNRIRKIETNGIIHTIMGDGTAGYSIDGTVDTIARVNGPTGLATDTAGNLYFSDMNNHLIRKISNLGIVTTVAGAGAGGDGGPAISASIGRPMGLAFDTAGNLYFADADAHRVRKITATTGIISTVAGIGIAGYAWDGFPATVAVLNAPYDVAVDHAGNLYIADQGNQRIRKVNTAGIITTVAGTGTAGYSGDGGPATNAKLFSPFSVKTDFHNAIYISDHGNNRIRKIDPVTGIISTVAGTGSAGFSGDTGMATAAMLNAPNGITFDRPDNLYICDGGNSKIRKVGSLNHPPQFIDSIVPTVVLCGSDTVVLDSFLHAFDPDTGQVISWSILSTPLHGTALASYSTPSTGDTVVPMGIKYVAGSAYNGRDTLKIIVTDGMIDDTIVINFHLGMGRTHPISVYHEDWGGGFFLADTIFCGIGYFKSPDSGAVWTSSDTLAIHVNDTTGYFYTCSCFSFSVIKHTITNACGTTSDSIRIHTLRCEGVGNETKKISGTISPNPAVKEFMLKLSTRLNEQAHVILRDIIGRKQNEFDMVTNADKLVDIDAPDGLYFITATTASGIWSDKVLIQRSQ